MEIQRNNLKNAGGNTAKIYKSFNTSNRTALFATNGA
jgi:hypothetical protein